MSLTKKLKNEHVQIVDALRGIQSNIIKGSSNSEFNLGKSVVAAKAALFAHLKHEEVELYPVLRKAAETDEEIRTTLKVLASNMEGVAKAAVEFFDKHESGSDPKACLADLAKLMAALGTRVRREEESLYSIYDRVSKKQNVA
jgi:hypothetical protein